MTDEKKMAPLDWRRSLPVATRLRVVSRERQAIARDDERYDRKWSSLVRCAGTTAAPALFCYLLFHLQIISSNQQELPPPPPSSASGVGRHQLVRYGSGGSSNAAKQIARRSFSANGQSGGLGSGSDAPKLIPLSALDRYQEGTDLRLFCSASAPKSAGRLYFEWRKNHNELLNGPASAPSQPLSSDLDEIIGPSAPGASSAPSAANKPTTSRLQISMMDESACVLRISSLEASDAGNYTCLVRNQQGSDSSTVRVNILVKMKWIVEPPGELQVRAGKLVQLECDASGQPAPLISWTSLKDHQTISSKLLRIDRVSTNDSGMYECRATRALAAAGSGGQNQYRDHGSEQLRKLVRLIVNGKC